MKLLIAFSVVLIALFCFFYKTNNRITDSYFESLTRIKYSKFYIHLYLKNCNQVDEQKFYGDLEMFKDRNGIVVVNLEFFNSILDLIEMKLDIGIAHKAEDVFIDGFGEKILIAIPNDVGFVVNEKALFKDLNLYIWSKGKNKINDNGFGDDITLY